MRGSWIGVGGRRLLAALVCLVVAGGLTAAGAGRAAPSLRGVTRATVAASFVSAFPLDDASEIDRYSLADGRSLGVLAQIPPLTSTAPSASVSTPHLMADGDYLLTLDHGTLCRSAHGRCHSVPDSCASQVETLNPVTATTQPLFSVLGAWQVLDAVPSPDGRTVALTEYRCGGNAARLEVRDLVTGRSHLVTRQLSECGLNSDVTWTPNSARLVFAYARHPNLNVFPAGCELATAPAGHTTGPARWVKLRPPTSCGFTSSAFDATGLVVIVSCSDNDGGATSTVAQYGRRGRALEHRALDSFDPPQYGLTTQLESDPAAHTVLVSEIVSDDPDVSDVWTFNGARLRHVGDYFGDAILAEP